MELLRRYFRAPNVCPRAPARARVGVHAGVAAIASEYPASLSRPIAAKLLFQPAFDFGGDLLLQICVSARRAGYCHAHQRVVGNPEVNDKFPGVRWPAKQAAQVIHVRRLVFLQAEGSRCLSYDALCRLNVALVLWVTIGSEGIELRYAEVD